MKNLNLVLILCPFFFITTNIFSQSDTLLCTSGVFHTYSLNGKKINSSAAKNIMRIYPETIPYIKESNLEKGLAIVFLGLGMTGIGASAYFFNEGNKETHSSKAMAFFSDRPIVFMGVGIPCTVIACYLIVAQNKNLQKAVKLFNQKNKTSRSPKMVSINYGIVDSGIGVQLNF